MQLHTGASCSRSTTEIEMKYDSNGVFSFSHKKKKDDVVPGRPNEGRTSHVDDSLSTDYIQPT